LNSDKDVNEARNKLWSIFTDDEEFMNRTYPESATFKGIHDYDDKLTDYSNEHIKIVYDTNRSYLNRLNEIDYSNLNDEDKLNFDIFYYNCEVFLDGEPFKFHYTPIWQQDGIHINFPMLAAYQPCNNNTDAEKYLKRLEGFGRQVDDTINNITSGIKAKITMPDFIIEQILPQLENIMIVKPGQSVFYQSCNENENISSVLKRKILDEIESVVYPGFQKLYNFIKTEYLPAGRKEAGLWSLPDGNAMYRHCIKNYTSTNASPDEIHETGLKEVARIKKEMELIISGLKFNGSFKEFNHHLKTNPEFFYTKKEDLMNGFRKILNKMDTHLPSLFGRLPEAGYDLIEMEEYRSASGPAAYYYPAPNDRTRPGYFYVNTFNLEARPKYGMTALALHEAVPGHHLQIALAQELEGLPEFRRDWGGATSYVEGWALYAESLGYQTGMYDDPYQKYGALSNEIWRACRLVVDTGIHHKKWTRQQAKEYMGTNTPNSEHDILAEVDRYIAFPGQALAYKIGEIKINDLKKLAESSLDGKFILKDFHDTLLGSGALPLEYLEILIKKWIKKIQEN
jgi:uncharacterized protein (DUF885 family)